MLASMVDAGVITIEFYDDPGNVIEMRLPFFGFTGVTANERFYKIWESLNFWYKKEELKAVIVFNPDKPKLLPKKDEDGNKIV